MEWVHPNLRLAHTGELAAGLRAAGDIGVGNIHVVGQPEVGVFERSLYYDGTLPLPPKIFWYRHNVVHAGEAKSVYRLTRVPDKIRHLQGPYATLRVPGMCYGQPGGLWTTMNEVMASYMAFFDEPEDMLFSSSHASNVVLKIISKPPSLGVLEFLYPTVKVTVDMRETLEPLYGSKLCNLILRKSQGV